MRFMIKRRLTRRVNVGSVAVGAGAPISVQSMTTTDTKNPDATIEQIHALEDAGCEIVRCAVPDEVAAKALEKIRSGINIPLVADIHFDYKLALIAVESGVDCLRINPGNIGKRKRVEEVVKVCNKEKIPIRIGVNSGSLEKSVVKKYGGPTAMAMVKSAMGHMEILKELDFHDVKVSLKASDIFRTIEANRIFAKTTDIPLHLGITEAGTHYSGTVKSSVGLGVLLYEGIGDTIRVSLTGDPIPEIKAGFEILKSLGLRERGINFISCPNCGRLEGQILMIIEGLEKSLADIDHPYHVAVMGCSVNGPGESRAADVGVIAAPENKFHIYKQQSFWKKADQRDVVKIVSDVIREMYEKEPKK